jgi:hypothetical protein
MPVPASLTLAMMGVVPAVAMANSSSFLRSSTGRLTL